MEYPGLQGEAEATPGRSGGEEEEDEEETEGCAHQDGMETQTDEKN